MKVPGFKLYTSLKDEYSCAIATFSIDGCTTTDIDSKLFERKKIHCTTVNQEKVHGVRITPHVYTPLRDLDKLVEGIQEIAAGY